MDLGRKLLEFGTLKQSISAGSSVLRVLIVHGDKAIRHAARRQFERDRMNTIQMDEAQTGAQAISLCNAPSFSLDCVIVGSHLSDMSGVELIQTLSVGTGALPVPLVLLGESDNAEQEALQAIGMGAQDYLMRSEITSRTLNRVVANAVERFLLLQQVKEKEQRLDIALKASATGMWDWDMRTDKVLWSSECFTIHGLQPSDFDGTAAGVNQLIHPADANRVWAAVRTAAQENCRYECEFRIVRPDDEVRWVANVGRAIYDANGTPIRVLGTITDVTQRKTMEHNLVMSEASARESREELQSLMEVMPAGVLIARDTACNHITANGVARAMLRVPGDQNVSKSAPEEEQPDFQVWSEGRLLTAEELPMQRAAAHGETVKDSVCEIKMPDGSQIDILGNVRPLFDEDNTLRGSVGVFIDVTAPRRRTANMTVLVEVQKLISQCSTAHDILSLSTKRIAAHFNLAHCVLSEIDEDSDTCTVLHDHAAVGEQSFSGIYKLSEFHSSDEFSQLSSGTPLVVNDTQASKRSQSRATQFDELGIGSFVCASYVLNGKWKFAMSVQRSVPSIWSPEDVELIKDLSERIYLRLERIRGEQALFESEQFNRTVVEASPDCFKVLDTDGTLLAINAAGLRMLELDDKSLLIGQNWESVWPEFQRDKVRSVIKAGVRGETIRFEDVCPTFKGTLKVWECLVAPVRDVQGNVVRLVALSRDVTERKQMEESLRSVDRQKDEFMATLAHELRNPLAPINTALKLLYQKISGDLEIEWMVDVIDRQARQLTRLVEELLDANRINRGVIELKTSYVSLQDIIRNALETSDLLIKSRGHTLTVNVPDDDIFLIADMSRLAQVFTNILNNAAKYTPRNGTISLSAARYDDSAVEITVTDNGIGLPSEKIGEIFEMFSQLEEGRSLAQGGLGIGLALVKKIVEKHGGRVLVRSAGQNQGSSFSVRLNALNTAPMTQLLEPLNDVPLEMRKLRILVVDDNRDTADTLSMYLSILGHIVSTAYDGITAIGTAASFLPDVIVCDITLPGANGNEVATQIRNQPWGLTAVLIAITGLARESDRVDSTRSGFDHFLVKPVDMDKLKKLLDQIPHHCD